MKQSNVDEYKLRVKIKDLFSEKHMFVRNEMKKTDKWKKMKYWINSHFNNKACFNVFLLFPVWGLVSINTFDFIQNEFSVPGFLSFMWLLGGAVYIVAKILDILTDRGGFSKLLFLNKENKEEYWCNFVKESVSLNVYKFLCENLSKEELMFLAYGKKSITYEDLWITYSYISKLSNYEKSKKEKELFEDKNKKLTHFLEVMHDELNKK